MEVKIDDELVERFKKVQQKGIEQGFFDEVPFETELEALLDKEITYMENEFR